MEVATKTLRLPCGLGPDKEGKIHREAEIAPMTGLVRKNIARPEVRQSMAKTVDVILLACLKRVGPISPIDRRVIDKLLTGDREFLILEVRKLSKRENGSIVNSSIKCNGCSETVDLRIDLNKFPMKELPDRPVDGLVEGNERLFKIDLLDGHSAKFRYPNGADQLEVSGALRQNPVDASYRLFSRCMVEWDGKPGDQASPTLFDDLPTDVLDEIHTSFMEHMPGPDMNQPMICPLCGHRNPMDMSASDFLFPQAKGRTAIA